MAGKCTIGNVEDWIFIANEVIQDYPKKSILWLKNSIMSGVKGIHGRSNFVSMQTIFIWLRGSDHSLQGTE